MCLENFKLIIDIVVALSTVATLIFIGLTLKEMKVNRYKLFEPQIFLINSEIFLLCNYPNVILPLKIAAKKEELKISENSDIYLEFRNIGQGIAKDILIDFSWNINYKEYFERLKSEFLERGIDLKMRISDGYCWINAIPEKKINYGGNFPFEKKAEFKFDYLLPVKNSNESLKISIPSSVKLMFSLTILLLQIVEQKIKKDVFQRLVDYFKVNINITYKDNLDKKFVKKFQLLLKDPKVEINSKYEGVIYTICIERENYSD